MKKTILLFVLFPFLVCAQSQDQNYVKTTTYKKPTSLGSVDTSLPANATIQVSYYDGLGRPIQQMAHKQSASGKDIVTPIEYDGFGRQVKDYLPYVSTSAASQNYKTDALTATGVLGYHSYSGQDPFSEKVLESSPMNRIMKQAAPGTTSSWAKGSGHEIKFEYTTNTANDGVRNFVVSTSWVASKELFDIPLTLTSTAYPINQLYKTITYDENTAAVPTENNGSTVEFKDKEGLVVLKRTYSTVNTGNILERHDTYYVYDQYGNLTFVLPPKVDTNIAITATVLSDLCYQYKYDYRNRLVEKKLPGKQWEFIVYDKLDRVIATGPALSPFSDINIVGNTGWMITKYDVFNRPILTGWMPSSTVTAAGRKTLQDLRNTDTTFSETKTATASPPVNTVAFNYTNVAFPASTTTYHVLTINYYDNYTSNLVFVPIISFTSSTTLPVYYNNTAGTLPKGLLTLSWVRVCETSTLYKAEKSYILYDKKARPIRNFSNNFLGGYTQVDTQMEEMTGRVNYTITKHKRLATADTLLPLQVQDNFSYSDQDRLLSHTQVINKPDGNALPEQLIAENTYDELGQLISKKVGNTSALPLQKIDYSYNIRGWLSEINKTGWNDASNTNPLTITGEPLDLFAFKINYNTIQNESGYTGKALFNGNIAETYWRTSGDNVLRKYGYFYDDINRLRAAIYQKPFTTVAVTNMYNESMRYDKNGNIMALQRNGDFDAQTMPLPIDDLTYSYDAGNRLQWVKENSNNNGLLGFKDGVYTNANTTTLPDYTYDDNGNMLTDRNKTITTNIKYNHLNLPTEIIFTATKKINYLYNALGQKVQKTVSQGTTTNITDYLGGYQYNKPSTTTVSTLQYFPHTEGYVNFDTNVYKYVFNYTDHLGNIRMSYTKDETTNLAARLEENHYYPFGLKHTMYNVQIMKLRGPVIEPVSNSLNAKYQYKYNGKEWQDELGLNMYSMDMRQYDPAIARWVVLDPVVHHNMSPYNSFDNNPVFWADPSGGDSCATCDEKGRKTSENGRYIPRSERQSSSETPPDDITVGSNGKVTHKVENGKPNKFFDENGKELFFNDINDKDSHMQGKEFNIGDLVFFTINKTELNKFIIKGGLEPLINNILFSSTFNLSYKYKAYKFAAENSHNSNKADFTHSVLDNYNFNKRELPNTYTGYDETSAYFRFGNQSTIYNWFDAGNFMWGNWMKFSQFNFIETKLGSEKNENFTDSSSDQRAIKNGFKF